MPAFSLPTALSFGIQSHSGAFIESIDCDATIEVAELLDSQGKVGRVHPWKPMSKGTVKGHDTMTVAPGEGDPGLGVSGGVTLITSVKTSEGNDKYNGWEYSWSNYPDATLTA